MKWKIISLTTSLLFLAGTTNFAHANYWEEDECPAPGGAPCFEYQDNLGNWWHFNGNSGVNHAGWHGPYPAGTPQPLPSPPPAMGNFRFCGTSDLSCSILSASCTLCLDGQVQKFQDVNGDWRVGVRVTGGSVTGGGLCGSISLSNFPWYAGDTATHTGFGNTTGIIYGGPLIGNMGNINLSAGFGLINITNGHVHNIEFDNNDPTGPSYFDFNSTIYTGGNADNASVCSVDGQLFVQAPVQDVNIR